MVPLNKRLSSRPREKLRREDNPEEEVVEYQVSSKSPPQTKPQSQHQPSLNQFPNLRLPLKSQPQFNQLPLHKSQVPKKENQNTVKYTFVNIKMMMMRVSPRRSRIEMNEYFSNVNALFRHYLSRDS